MGLLLLQLIHVMLVVQIKMVVLPILIVQVYHHYNLIYGHHGMESNLK
jgi:hypothetical protein